jgi:hypothetical protein
MLRVCTLMYYRKITSVSVSIDVMKCLSQKMPSCEVSDGCLSMTDADFAANWFSFRRDDRDICHRLPSWRRRPCWRRFTGPVVGCWPSGNKYLYLKHLFPITSVGCVAVVDGSHFRYRGTVGGGACPHNTSAAVEGACSVARASLCGCRCPSAEQITMEYSKNHRKLDREAYLPLVANCHQNRRQRP